MALDGYDIAVNTLLHRAHPVVLVHIGTYRIESSSSNREGAERIHGATIVTDPGLYILDGGC